MGRQNSALIAYLRLVLVASPLILGYDATAWSNLAFTECGCISATVVYTDTPLE